jgi:hypothetical protein
VHTPPVPHELKSLEFTHIESEISLDVRSEPGEWLAPLLEPLRLSALPESQLPPKELSSELAVWEPPDIVRSYPEPDSSVAVVAEDASSKSHSNVASGTEASACQVTDARVDITIKYESFPIVIFITIYKL